MHHGSRPPGKISSYLCGIRRLLSRNLEIPAWICERITSIGKIQSRCFRIPCGIWGIPFKFSQILKEIREVPHRITEIRDVFREETLVTAPIQERIAQIRGVIV